MYFFDSTNLHPRTLFRNLGIRNIRIGGGTVDRDREGNYQVYRIGYDIALPSAIVKLTDAAPYSGWSPAVQQKPAPRRNLTEIVDSPGRHGGYNRWGKFNIPMRTTGARHEFGVIDDPGQAGS